MRKVVNELIRRYGKPSEIVLEIARKLPLGAKTKKKLIKQQKEGRQRNEKASAELLKLNIIDNRANRQKSILWEQLASDPSERRCPYSGQIIPLAKLFTDFVEIEHILPFSRTLDDSMANKTLSTRSANRQKGNETPFEAFGDSDEWPDILQRSLRLPNAKKWRFKPNAMDKFNEENGFLNRQINDVRYISRYTWQYLTTIIPEKNIWVVTGRLTALLRSFWGLNHILSEGGNKNRNDHRHHAVDALVIGLISRSMVQRLSRAAGQEDSSAATQLFYDNIRPWEGFLTEAEHHIGQILVSYRTRKKDQGQLHNDTAYGLIDAYNPNGSSQVVQRKDASYFTKKDKIERIRDLHLRQELLEKTSGLSGKELKSAVESWFRDKKMRGVRIVEKLTVIPIKDKKGHIYKGYKGNGNAYIHIFEIPSSGQWKAECVSRFNANQSGFTPMWRQKYPDASLIMELRQDDMIVTSQNGEEVFYYVQRISGSEICLVPPHEANADARNREQSDPFKLIRKSPTSLKTWHAQKVHISPTGLSTRE